MQTYTWCVAERVLVDSFQTSTSYGILNKLWRTISIIIATVTSKTKSLVLIHFLINSRPSVRATYVYLIKLMIISSNWFLLNYLMCFLHFRKLFCNVSPKFCNTNIPEASITTITRINYFIEWYKIHMHSIMWYNIFTKSFCFSPIV